MSDLLYRTALRWHDSTGRGVARHEGVEVELYSAPRVLLPMGPLVELEYVPGLGVAYVQPRAGQRTDMLARQVSECLGYLRQIALAARTAVDARWVP